MLLQDIDRGLDLRPLPEEVLLPRGHDFPALFVVWWGEHEGLRALPQMFAHDSGSVVAVTDAHLRAGIEDDLGHLPVVDGGIGEDDGGEFPAERDREMEFEAVVPALVVLPEGSDCFRYAMPIRTVQLADGHHRTVPDLDRVFRAQKLLQEEIHLRGDAVTLIEEASVLRQSREEMMEVETREGVHIHHSLLMDGDGVPDEDRDEVRVAEDGRATAEGWIAVLCWQMNVYPATKTDDMVWFQKGHGMQGNELESRSTMPTLFG